MCGSVLWSLKIGPEIHFYFLEIPEQLVLGHSLQLLWEFRCVALRIKISHFSSSLVFFHMVFRVEKNR